MGCMETKTEATTFDCITCGASHVFDTTDEARDYDEGHADLGHVTVLQEIA